MKSAPRDLSLNDETDYGLCFACGPRNPSGLHLTFHRDGRKIVTSLDTRSAHQGFPDYLHGGVITSLLDEVMSRVSLLENRWTMTAQINVRFRIPIPIGQKVTASAEKSRELRGFMEAKGEVKFPDGRIAAYATGKFSYIDHETLRVMSHQYPKLSAEWMR